MKIFLGSDHGGFALKEQIKAYLTEKAYEVEDLGCYSEESCDYPLFGVAVAKAVKAHSGSFGIVVCGSGVGISIAANKVQGIRCVLANTKELARLGREHNGAQLLALGARTKNFDDPLAIVETFLHTPVDEHERHVRRRRLLDDLCA